MSLDDELKKLPQSMREVPKFDQDFENRKQFVNTKIFPPLLKVQQVCGKSQSAFYVKLPFARQPVSLRNFPEALTLVWGETRQCDTILWKYCISVTLNFLKAYILVTIGNRDFEIVLMDADFDQRYDTTLTRALQALQEPESNPCHIGTVSWQRLYRMKL